MLSHVQLFATPWTVVHQASLSMRFLRQEYCSGLPFPSPGDLPNPGIEPASPALAGRFFTAICASLARASILEMSQISTWKPTVPSWIQAVCVSPSSEFQKTTGAVIHLKELLWDPLKLSLQDDQKSDLGAAKPGREQSSKSY